MSRPGGGPPPERLKSRGTRVLPEKWEPVFR